MALIMRFFCVAFLTLLASYLSLGQIEHRQDDCIDRFNRSIAERSVFQPVEDPCVFCFCLKARPVKCRMMVCPTPIPNKFCHFVVPSLISCCSFTCHQIPSYENDDDEGELMIQNQNEVLL